MFGIPAPILIAIPAALAIIVFFWSLDRVRVERVEPSTPSLPRATPRELVERLLRPAAESLNERRASKGRPTLAEDMVRAGLTITPAEYLLMWIGLVSIAVLIGLFRFGFSLGPVLLGVVAFFVPPFVVRYLQGRRTALFNEQLNPMLTLLSNSLKTGYPVQQAIEMIGQKLQPPISTEFERVATETTLGTSIEDSLSALLKRIDSPDLEFIVTAILLHARVGGNLAEILDTIGDTLRDRLQTKRDMRVLTAQARASGYVVTGLPIILAFGMYAFTPGYFAPMTSTFFGYVLIGIAVFLILIGNLIINRMVSVEA